MCRPVLFFALLSSVLFAANPALTLQVSSETAPPGGYAQFKISLTAPALVSSASVTMNFDPTIFGNITNVAAFSATGDQTGSAVLNGTQVVSSFTSASASLGQLPDLPVFVVTVPVLATAKIGATSSITVDPTRVPWQNGNATYTVNVNPGTLTVGGALSIQSVTPGGGLLPSGTVVAINGTGFDATTTVAIDGVSLASTQLVSSTELDVTLGGATEMSGKHVHAATRAGASVDYFAGLTGVIVRPTSTLVLLLPSLSSPPYTAVAWDYQDSGFASYYSCLQNPTASPVTATYYFAVTDMSNTPATTHTIVVPPYGLYVADTSTFASSGLGVIYMTASAPIRMAELFTGFSNGISVSPRGQITSLGFLRTQAEGSGDPALWNWKIGTPAPQPETVRVIGAFPFTVSLSSDAQAWLTVTPAQGAPPTMLTLTPNVAQLGQGTYRGTVTLTPVLPPALAQFGPGTLSFEATLNVYTTPPPTISVSGSASFQATNTGPPPAPVTVNVTSNAAPAPFTTSIGPGNWLSVTPSSGTTPATLTLTANPVGLAVGVYQSNLIIQGPGNATGVTAQLTISNASPGALSVSPTALAFSLIPGGRPPLNQVVAAQPPLLGATISVTTQTGGNWLNAIENDAFVSVSLNPTAANLAPGTYQGSVTIASPNLNLSATVPVTLIVGPLPGPAQLTVSPSVLTLTAPAGTMATGTLNVNLASGSPYFTMQISSVLPFELLATPLNPPPAFTTPSAYIAPATFQIQASGAQPGIYLASITISWGGGSAVIPVTYYATATPSSPPTMSALVGSGSETPGSIAPGELITIFGSGLGGAPASGGTQVLVNGTPAPMIYASTGQVNAIVPYEASGTASVQVVAGGIKSGVWDLPVVPSVPSIFTAFADGVGQGAVVNQDGSLNNETNPAARGTAIQIYATGGGQTSPPSSTGSVAQAAASLTLPVTVTIGGVQAQVLYAGNAPGEIEGVVQINTLIPSSVAPGAALPVVVTIGGVASQTRVTIAIR
jgi:uncharacterized protein (TIGR03437 family)